MEQDPIVLAPPHPTVSACLFSVENFSQRISLITTVQKHQFFGIQLSSQSNSHIHT